MSNNIIQSSSSSTLTNKMIEGLKINGETIVKIDPHNNMVHLTYMCQKGGKRANDYTRSDRFKNLKAALEEERSDTHYRVSPIVQMIHGDGGGTWVHPDLAIDCAQWISPRFGLAVSRLVRNFLTGQVTTQQSQDAARHLASEMKDWQVEREKGKESLKIRQDAVRELPIRANKRDYARMNNRNNQIVLNRYDKNTRELKKEYRLKERNPLVQIMTKGQVKALSLVNEMEKTLIEDSDVKDRNSIEKIMREVQVTMKPVAVLLAESKAAKEAKRKAIEPKK